MKNQQYIFKTILITAIVLVIMQSCIPTAPVGGNPSAGYPSPPCNNFFVLNTTTQVQAYNPLFITQSSMKDIRVGVDSMGLTLNSITTQEFGNDVYMQELILNIMGNEEDVSAFQYVTLTDSFQYTLYGNMSYGNCPAVLDKNTYISEVLPSSIYVWKGMMASVPVGATMYYGTISLGSRNWYNFTANEEKYMVLRKRIGSNYQYYSIRIHRESSAPLLTLNIGSKLSVYYGCMQMNNIVTGQ